MALFKFQWLRSFIRRNTNPIERDKAAVWKKRLSIGYALLAWNAFGLVLFMVYKGKGDWAKYHGLKSEEEMALTPAQQWTRTLGIKDATVLRVSGLKMSKYEIHNDFEKETEERKKSMSRISNFLRGSDSQEK